MSTRRFRILSDSEDENEPSNETTTENRSRVTDTKAEIASLDSNNIPDFGKKKKNKRARLVSDESDDERDATGSENDSHLSETSNPNRERSFDCRPVRSHSRASESSSLEQQADGNQIQVEQGSGSIESRALQPNQDDVDEVQTRVERESSENEQVDTQNENDEAEESTERRIMKKRVVKNPQPKLDAARLTGDRGLGRLRNMSPNIHLRGKGFEHEDVKCILHNIQLWGHRMFPKMQLKDILERCERLGTKIPARVYLRRMRTGEIHDFNKPIIDSEEDITRGVDENRNESISERLEEAQPQIVAHTENLFQELLDQHTALRPDVIGPEGSSETNDLIARIQAKKAEAIEKRAQLKAQREAQQREEELVEAQISFEKEAMVSNIDQ